MVRNFEVGFENAKYPIESQRSSEQKMVEIVSRNILLGTNHNFFFT